MFHTHCFYGNQGGVGRVEGEVQINGTENSEADLHRHEQVIRLYSYNLVAEGQPL